MRTYDQIVCREIALYILGKSKINTLDNLYKIQYLADKLHLFRYGCLIYDEIYNATQNGPIPTMMFKILNSDLKNFQIKFNQITSIRESDQNHITESSIECINEILEQWCIGKLSLADYKDKAWEKSVLNECISIIAIAESIPNSEKLVAYLKQECNEKKAIEKNHPRIQ